jgi:hypothetical protein
MITALPAMLPAIDPPARQLIGGGLPRAPLALMRAQSGTRATALAADGATWLDFGANEARAAGAAPRLLIEGQRTNNVPNPRAEGAVAGTPGTLPANWSIAITASGVSREIVGAVTVAGLPGLRVRFFGTPAANGNIQVLHLLNNVVPASAGQVWTSTCFYRLAGGALTNITNIRHRTRVAGSNQDVLTVLSPAMDGTLRRYGHTLTCNAGATFIYAELTSVITSGQAVDATMDVIAPQLELGPAASTPILPPSGSPGASTRGADLVTASLAALGISL